MSDVIETTAEDVPKEEPQSPKKETIETDKSGALVAKNIDDLWRIATMAIKSGFVPKGYTKPEQVVVALQHAVSLGLPATPSSLTNIAVINNTPSIFGDLPLKLVRESGDLEHIDEYLITKDYEKICLENKNLNSPPYAAVCEIKRKTYELQTYTWTMDDQEKTKSRNPVWAAYPSIMLKRKARNIALKDQFSDVLGPAPLAEYHEAEFRDITPEKKKTKEADTINNMFGGEDGKQQPTE